MLCPLAVMSSPLSKCFYKQTWVVSYLDLSDEFVVLIIFRVWEFIDFYFVLLYLFHDLMKGENNHNKGNWYCMHYHPLYVYAAQNGYFSLR